MAANSNIDCKLITDNQNRSGYDTKSLALGAASRAHSIEYVEGAKQRRNSQLADTLDTHWALTNRKNLPGPFSVLLTWQTLTPKQTSHLRPVIERFMLQVGAD
jgi:hypothetical protein